MTDDALYTEIERRADEANKTPRGADFPAIVQAVADEAGVTYRHARGVWLDRAVGITEAG